MDTKKTALSVGTRVLDKRFNITATVTKQIESAISPTDIVAYIIRYDEAPPVEYNMGVLDSLEFRWSFETLKI